MSASDDAVCCSRPCSEQLMEKFKTLCNEMFEKNKDLELARTNIDSILAIIGVVLSEGENPKYVPEWVVRFIMFFFELKIEPSFVNKAIHEPLPEGRGILPNRDLADMTCNEFIHEFNESFMVLSHLCHILIFRVNYYFNKYCPNGKNAILYNELFAITKVFYEITAPVDFIDFHETPMRRWLSEDPESDDFYDIPHDLDALRFDGIHGEKGVLTPGITIKVEKPFYDTFGCESYHQEYPDEPASPPKKEVRHPKTSVAVPHEDFPALPRNPKPKEIRPKVSSVEVHHEEKHCSSPMVNAEIQCSPEEEPDKKLGIAITDCPEIFRTSMELVEHIKESIVRFKEIVTPLKRFMKNPNFAGTFADLIKFCRTHADFSGISPDEIKFFSLMIECIIQDE